MWEAGAREGTCGHTELEKSLTWTPCDSKMLPSSAPDRLNVSTKATRCSCDSVRRHDPTAIMAATGLTADAETLAFASARLHTAGTLAAIRCHPSTNWSCWSDGRAPSWPMSWPVMECTRKRALTKREERRIRIRAVLTTIVPDLNESGWATA
ncbi:hypothetical protein GCM10010411_55450 [Actinomadura fulvescens]|uniref:Uncharacterized protein n=1 Tax=Actinomadura fulvescens TaxID=46160 RepID=A0ABP6CFK7_9ACTN